jgi:hypothetical protein
MTVEEEKEKEEEEDWDGSWEADCGIRAMAIINLCGMG